MLLAPLEIDIHESHDLVEDPPNGYSCSNCWGCPCHSIDLLKTPCTEQLTVTPKSLVRTPKNRKAQ